jgi:hypothetical protein
MDENDGYFLLPHNPAIPKLTVKTETVAGSYPSQFGYIETDNKSGIGVLHS